MKGLFLTVLILSSFLMRSSGQPQLPHQHFHPNPPPLPNEGMLRTHRLAFRLHSRQLQRMNNPADSLNIRKKY